MADLHFGMNVSHNLDAGAKEIGGIAPRLLDALRSATRDATRLEASNVASTIAGRTSMTRAVADSITKSKYFDTATGGEGRVSLSAPPARIYPKNKQALAFSIGGRRIVRKSVRGSRPYKLVGRSALLSQKAVETIYGEKIREVLG